MAKGHWLWMWYGQRLLVTDRHVLHRRWMGALGLDPDKVLRVWGCANQRGQVYAQSHWEATEGQIHRVIWQVMRKFPDHTFMRVRKVHSGLPPSWR